jgi:hypothetical protein
MTPRITLAAALLAASVTAPAFAQGQAALKPIQSRSIDLGAIGGDAYYTVENGGYHVVATFQQHAEAAVPVRFEAVLAPGQSVRFSTPGPVGTPATTVEILRRADAVVVQKPAS